ncbi:WD40 repeat-like protein [Hortaea werneckii]|nr:WD40 repeat-like protein [Hortaea werneckii]KAI7108465.1 WD40 repeat-like protein [Hortaea werneckii]KAI7234015.1 WD40 repeat-like protein [Hortaea werneckii]KAI7311513.1 WD40 repeat-like protein [Hortaea werneckii]KAI7361684.1 WD40 repeat-like protein [Hortaea werneckii]
MSIPFPTTPTVRLTNHHSGSPVHALTFSAGTGQYLLTGSQDRQIRLFNPSSAKLIQTYSAHGYEVLDLAVAEDNSRFVSGGGDKTVFLWDVAAGVTLRRFTGHAGRVNAVAFGGVGDGVVLSGSFDGTVKVWDAKSRSERPIMSLGEARDAVSSVFVRGHEVLVGSVDGRVRIYDLAMGHVDTDVLGASVTSVMPTMANDSYLVSTLDSHVRLMDRPAGKCLQSFTDKGFRNESYRIRSTLAMADSVAMSGSEDGSIVAWDVLSGKVLHTFRHAKQDDVAREGGQKQVVSAVAWNQMRKTWASAGGDGTVVVWGGDD